MAVWNLSIRAYGQVLFTPAPSQPCEPGVDKTTCKVTLKAKVCLNFEAVSFSLTISVYRNNGHIHEVQEVLRTLLDLLSTQRRFKV